MNRIRFTNQRLEKLTCPPGKSSDYFHDEDVRGLVIYVSQTGAKTFYLYKRINGRPTRLRLGSWPHELTIEAARKEARMASGEVAKGNDPHNDKITARRELTFGEVFAKHIEHAKSHNKSWHENQRQYELHLVRWANRRVSEISRADVERLHASMGEKNGKYIANRTLALVHHIFAKTAIKCGFTGTNPAHGIEKFKERSRERFLQSDELPRFFAALEQEPVLFRDFFTLALLTGARRDNLQSMRWEDVNTDRAVWHIPDTKSGEPVSVPLVADALTILTRRREADPNGQFVFPSHGASGHLEEPKSAWRRILKRAGIENLRVHDLRRTFGSWQAGAGVPIHTIGKSMGHKNNSTTAIYARLSLDPVREAVNLGTAAMMAAARATKEESK